MAFGAKIKLQVDKTNTAQLGQQIQNEVNKAAKGAKLQLSIADFDIDTAKLQSKLDQKGFALKINKIDATNAVSALRTQLQEMLTGLTITGLKDFVSPEAADAARRAAAAEQEIVDAQKKRIAQTELLLKQNQGLAVAQKQLAEAQKRAAEIENKTSRNDKLDQIRQQQQAIERLASLEESERAESIASIERETAAIHKRVSEIIKAQEAAVKAENATSQAAVDGNKKLLDKLTNQANAALRQASKFDQPAQDAIKEKWTAVIEKIEIARKVGDEQRQSAVANAADELVALNQLIQANANLAKGSNNAQTQLMSSAARMRAQINTYIAQNPRVYSQFKGEIDNMMSALANSSTLTKDSLAGLRIEFTNLTTIAQQAGIAGRGFFDLLREGWAKFGSWSLVTKSMMAAVNSIKQMISAVQDLDSAMTDLRKVTDLTEASYDAFFKKATDSAKRIGATVSDTISATADFSRLGFDLDDASFMAEAALVYKNVGDDIDDIGDATNSLISTIKAFRLEASDAMLVIDEFNEVGNNFAITSDGIGEALQRSASALFGAGNSLEQSIGLITAANAVIQNPESVGTAMKTVTMYLRAAKTEAEEAGISTDGMADSVSKLRGELMSLTGVDIMIDADNFKSTYQILKEISAKWEDLDDTVQSRVTELMGGKRNANVLQALLTNFEDAENAMISATNAAGSAFRENSAYMDSIAGRISVIQAKFEELSASVINADALKFVLSLGSAVMDLLNTLARLNLIIPTLTTIFGFIKGAQAINTAQSFAATVGHLISDAKALENFGDIITEISGGIAGMSNAQRGMIRTIIQGEDAFNNLNEAQRAELLTALQNKGMFDAMNLSLGNLKGSLGNLISAIPVWAKIAIGVAGVITVISWLKNGMDEYREKAIESGDAVVNSFEDARKSHANNIKSLESLRGRYEALSAGVDENGKNVSLTAEEYAEFKDIVNQLIEISPNIVTAYDNQGNAVLNYKSALDDAIESQDEFNKNSLQAYLDGGSDLYKGQRVKFGDTSENVYVAGSKLSDWINRNTSYDPRQLIAELFGIDTLGTDLGELFSNYEIYSRIAHNETTIAALKGILKEGQSGAVQREIDNLINGLIRDVNELDSIESVEIDFLTKYLENYANESVKAMLVNMPERLSKRFREGLTSVNNPNASLKDNEIAAEEFANRFYEELNSTSGIALQAMAQNVSEGTISMEDLQSQLDEYAQSAGESNIVTSALCAYFLDVASASSNAASGIGEVARETNGFSKAVESMQSGYDILSKANGDMAKGGLSAATIAAIQKEIGDNGNVFDYIYSENGILKLNTEAWIQRSEAMMSYDISALNEQARTIEKERDALLAEEKDYEELGRKMQEKYGSNGNVDLTNRPLVYKDGAVETVFSHTILAGKSNEADIKYDSNIIMNVTPILPDGTELSETELYDYIRDILQQSSDTGASLLEIDKDNLGLIINIDDILPDEDIAERKNQFVQDAKELSAAQAEFYEIGIADVELENIHAQTDAYLAAGDAVRNATDALKDMGTVLSAIANLNKLSAQAATEMAVGGLTQSTVDSIASALGDGEHLSDYIYTENGQLMLNVDAWNARTKAIQENNLVRMEIDKAKLETKLDGLEEGTHEYESTLNELQRVNEEIEIYKTALSSAGKFNGDEFVSGISAITSGAKDAAAAMDTLNAGTALTKNELMDLVQKYPQLMEQYPDLLNTTDIDSQRVAVQSLINTYEQQYQAAIAAQIATQQAILDSDDASDEAKASAERAIQSLMTMADIPVFAQLTAGANETASALSELKKFADDLANRRSISVTSAIEEMSGGLSIDTLDTINSLLTSEEKLTDYVSVENGVLKLNRDAWNDRTSALMRARVAGLEHDRSVAIAERDAAPLDSAEWTAANDKVIQLNQEIAILTAAMNSIPRTTGMEDFAGELQNVSSAAKDAVSAMETLNSGTALTQQQMMDLALSYPELLSNPDFFNATTVESQKRLVQDVIDLYEKQYDAAIDARIALLQTSLTEESLSEEEANNIRNTIASLEQLKGVNVFDNMAKGAAEVVNMAEKIEKSISGVIAARNMGGNSGYIGITYDEYKSLIEVSNLYSTCIEKQNGHLMLNAQKYDELTNKLMLQSKAEAEAAAQAILLDEHYQDLASRAGSLGSDEQVELDRLNAQIMGYSMLADSIDKAMDARSRFDNADSSIHAESFESLSNAVKVLYDTKYNKKSDMYGMVGREQYKEALTFLIRPEIVDDDKAVKKVIEKYQTYIEDGKKGILTFQKDMIKAGFMDENTKVIEGDIAEISKSLGITEDAFRALIDEINQYLTEKITIKEVSAITGVANDINNATSAIDNMSDVDMSGTASEIKNVADAADDMVDSTSKAASNIEKIKSSKVKSTAGNSGDAKNNNAAGLKKTLDDIEGKITSIESRKITLNTNSAVASVQRVNNSLSTLINRLNQIARMGTIRTSVVTTQTTVKQTIVKNGDSAFASGSPGVAGGRALVGELGPETVVDPNTNRYYVVGAKGAEFVNLPKGAIVFNANQTKRLFESGRIPGRGTAMVNGNVDAGQAYAVGTVKIPNESAAKIMSTLTKAVTTNINKALQTVSTGTSKIATATTKALSKTVEKVTGKGITDTSTNSTSKSKSSGSSTTKPSGGGGGGGGASSSKLEEIQKKYEELNAQLQHLIEHQEFLYKQADKALDTSGMEAALAEEARIYREMMANAQQAVRDMIEKGADDTSKELQAMEQAYWSAYDSLYSTLDKINNLYVEKINAKIDGIQSAFDTLTKASEELSESGGISIDTLQQLASGGLNYLSLLQETDGQYRINEEAVAALIAAEKEQLAIETALSYIRQLHDALENNELQRLANLVNLTNTYSNSTWGAVYAQAALLRQSDAVTDDMYNQIVSNIKAMQAMSMSVSSGIASISRTTSSSISTGYKEQYDALEQIRRLTEDLIRAEVNERIDAIKKQVDEYKKIVDLKKESLRTTKEENDYTKSVADKTKKIAQLQVKISQLSLDDSRAARAERAKLEEELAELQGELGTLQTDHSVEAQEDALDKLADKYEENRQGEIDALENSISSAEKLYRLAIQRIDNQWDSLYKDLIDWNTENGSSLNSEITENWNKAALAVQNYGSYVQAVAKLEPLAQSTSSSGGSSYSGFVASLSTAQQAQIDKDAENAFKVPETPQTNVPEEPPVQKVQQLKIFNGTRNIRDRASTNGKLLGTVKPGEIYEYGGETKGDWYSIMYKDKKAWIHKTGAELFEDIPMFHTGGVVGEGSGKDKEVLALLKEDEMVLTEGMKNSLYRLVDFSKVLGERLGVIVDNIAEPIMDVMTLQPKPVSANAAAALAGTSVFSPTFNVTLNHSGDMSDADARQFGERIASTALDKLYSAFEKRGMTGSRGRVLKP